MPFSGGERSGPFCHIFIEVAPPASRASGHLRVLGHPVDAPGRACFRWSFGTRRVVPAGCRRQARIPNARLRPFCAPGSRRGFTGLEPTRTGGKHRIAGAALDVRGFSVVARSLRARHRKDPRRGRCSGRSRRAFSRGRSGGCGPARCSRAPLRSRRARVAFRRQRRRERTSREPIPSAGRFRAAGGRGGEPHGLCQLLAGHRPQGPRGALPHGRCADAGPDTNRRRRPPIPRVIGA